jgi:ribonuclease G
MTKELFVSTTPHETKVGLVEDDLLAEIYLERENEYTLAGSIYKGRVTRVLPGMQSAFVDIGLERDAFLYVSDFMELQDEDEVEELPTSPSPAQSYQPRPEAQPGFEEPMAAPAGEMQFSAGEPAMSSAVPAESRERPSGEKRDGREFRGRRRRGRGGDRIPKTKFPRPSAETPRAADPERTEAPFDRP